MICLIIDSAPRAVLSPRRAPPDEFRIPSTRFALGSPRDAASGYFCHCFAMTRPRFSFSVYAARPPSRAAFRHEYGRPQKAAIAWHLSCLSHAIYKYRRALFSSP